MGRIDISNLDKFIVENDNLIVGSPMGVGFSTYISEIIAHYLFFNNNYTILVLTDSRREKNGMLFKIQKAYKYFGENMELGRDGDILYTLQENGSGVMVINYDEYPLANISTTYDFIIVDRDDCSNYLYDNFWRLKKYSKKLLFNTYDLPHSIFYQSEIKKITLTSKHSEKNLKDNISKHPNSINYDRKITGEFNEY